MPQSKDVLFIIDPINSLEPGHDTSLGLMEAAIKSGDRVFVTTPKDLVIASDGNIGSIYAAVQEVASFVQQAPGGIGAPVSPAPSSQSS